MIDARDNLVRATINSGDQYRKLLCIRIEQQFGH
jgi:hypothetical protein